MIPRHIPPHLNAIVYIIRGVETVESWKPWEHAFRCLPTPFKAGVNDPFDFLFEAWDNFWKEHGRAVWERNFWAPYRPTCIKAKQRKYRQNKAVTAFRHFATELFRLQGRRRILRQLKARPSPGWWYRSGRVSLLSLFRGDQVSYNSHMLASE